MKYISTKENLHRGLSLIGSVAQKNTHLPILNHVLLDARDKNLKAVATNLEIAVVAKIRAVVDSDGSFTVPAKTIMDYVGLLQSDTVECDLAGSELKVKGGRSTTKIKGVPAEEFPLVPPVDNATRYVLDRNLLWAALSQVVYAASHSEVRPELQGVLMSFHPQGQSGRLILAATDSFRLAERSIPMSGDSKLNRVIVPSRTALEMMRVIQILKDEEETKEVEIFIGEGQLKFVCGPVELTSRLIEGNYPDYAQIIPKHFETEVEVGVAELQNAVKAASLFAVSGINAVSLTVKPEAGLVSIASMSTQLGEHETQIEAKISGKENSIVLNFRYLLDALATLGGPQVNLKIINAESPCVLRTAGDEEALAIIMPIRQ